MGALSLLPLVLSASPAFHHFTCKTQLIFSTSVPSPLGSSISPCLSRVRNQRIVVFGSSSGKTNGSQFLDDDGVVEDMDGYMNYLSLEYDSVWDTKPSWCQPWTIMLTGISVTAASWFVLRSLAVTTVILLVICLWWYIFLYSYPKAYSDMISERRKKVTDGLEDTFGLRKRQ